MRENVYNTGPSLEDQLSNSQRQNNLHLQELLKARLRVTELRDKERTKSRLSIALSAISVFAVGIALYFKDANEDLKKDLRAEITKHHEDLRSKQLDYDVLNITDRLEIARLSRFVPKKLVVTSEDAPPTPESRPSLSSYEQKIEILSDNLGKDYVTHLLEMTSQEKNNKDEAHELPQDVTVTGEHKFLKASEMRNYLNGFPVGWIAGNVKKITLHKEEHGDAISYAYNAKSIASFNIDDDRIEIYGSTIKETDLTAFDRVVAHEIAHANDWRNSGKLSKAERINLLAKVYARLISDDRYVSSYVESIQGASTETTKSHQCEEYFAEIVAAYFNNPTELNYKDYTIVHDLVAKDYPNFDIESAKLTRAQAFSTYRKL